MYKWLFIVSCGLVLNACTPAYTQKADNRQPIRHQQGMSRTEAMSVLQSALGASDRPHNVCATKGFWIDDQANPGLDKNGDIALTAFRPGTKIKHDSAHNYYKLEYFPKTISLKTIRAVNVFHDKQFAVSFARNCDEAQMSDEFNYVVLKTDSPDMLSLRVHKKESPRLMQALSVLLPHARRHE